MLTISQLASFAEVTVRAVRHYHATGLLPEPDRDASGYRRYDATAAVELIRIRTLAAAGVPLARVRELIAADPEQFAAAVQQIDQDLQRRIGELQDHRQDIARLAAGDSLVLPPEVSDYLTRLQQIGVSQRLVEIERDGWILLTAHSPDEVALWATQKAEGLRDPQFRAIYRTYDQAFDWSPDDPRLAELARTIVGYVSQLKAGLTDRGPEPSPAQDSTLLALVASNSATLSPAWQRLDVLLEHELMTSGVIVALQLDP